MTLTNSTVNGNSAHFGGGGIFNDGPFETATLTNSTISGNKAGNGGGIYNLGTLNAISSTISGNTAGLGGGVANSGVLNSTNTTVSGNTAYRYGGGIFNITGLFLTNSTISGNSASVGGGGGISSMSGGGGDLTNSIVADQTSGGDCQIDGGGRHNSLGYNLDSDGTCNLTAASDLPNTNPQVAPLALNPPGTTQTQALLLGSPAIDHIPPGVNGCGTTSSTDQRGVSRPQGSGCDVGAYELLPGAPTPTPTPPPIGGIVALHVSGSDHGSTAIPIALVGGAALTVTMGVWFGRRRWDYS